MNSLIKNKIIQAIDWYQKTISPDHGIFRRATCRFTPTCSEYGKEAIMKHGWKGVSLTILRVLKCNPLITKSGTVDPVP